MNDEKEGQEPKITPAGTRLTKHEMMELAEDPYFCSLINAKVTSQIKTVIIALASVAAAIAGYMGIQLSRLDTARKQVQEARQQIQNNVDFVKKQAAVARGDADQLHLFVKEKTDQLQKSGDYLTGISALLGSFFGAKEAALEKEQADMEKTSANVEVIAKRAEAAQTTIDKAESGVTNSSGQIIKEMVQFESEKDMLTTNLSVFKTFQDLQQAIITTATSAKIILRAKSSRTIELPDISNPSENIKITFTVGRMGSGFKLHWNVSRRPGDAVPGEQIITAPRTRQAEATPQEISLTGTPFKATVDFVQYGIFAHDFIYLTVAPTNSVLTPKITIQLGK